MARSSSPWRALRPALLAGAAAVTWLTLSPTAASADTGPDSSSLLGGVTSTVSSLTHDLAEAASTLPASPPVAPAADPGLLRPAVTPVSNTADNLVASVPVVNQIVPAGSVSAVSVPLVGVVDDATAGVVQGVVAPAAEAVPALEPVLEPVSDLLAGSVPLPGVVPGLPLEAVPTELPGASNPDSADAGPTTPDAAADVPATVQGPEQDPADVPAAAPGGSNAGLQTIGALALAGPHMDASALFAPVELSVPVDPAPLPGQVPAAPGSAAGSSGASGGPSGAAAWLSSFHLGLERPGAVPAGGASQHAPAPVSFDPGSSPD